MTHFAFSASDYNTISIDTLLKIFKEFFGNFVRIVKRLETAINSGYRIRDEGSVRREIYELQKLTHVMSSLLDAQGVSFRGGVKIFLQDPTPKHWDYLNNILSRVLSVMDDVSEYVHGMSGETLTRNRKGIIILKQGLLNRKSYISELSLLDAPSSPEEIWNLIHIYRFYVKITNELNKSIENILAYIDYRKSKNMRKINELVKDRLAKNHYSMDLYSWVSEIGTATESTREAIPAFQKNHGLEVTGDITQETLYKLGIRVPLQ